MLKKVKLGEAIGMVLGHDVTEVILTCPFCN